MSEDKKRSFVIAVKTKVEKAGKEDLKSHLDSVDKTIEKVSKGLSGLSKKMTTLNTKSAKTLATIAKTLSVEAETLTKSTTKSQNIKPNILANNPAIDRIAEEVSKLASYFESKKVSDIEAEKQKSENKKRIEADQQAKKLEKEVLEAKKQSGKEFRGQIFKEIKREKEEKKQAEKNERQLHDLKQQSGREFKKQIVNEINKEKKQQREAEIAEHKTHEAKKQSGKKFSQELIKEAKKEEKERINQARINERQLIDFKKQEEKEERRRQDLARKSQEKADRESAIIERETRNFENKKKILDIKKASDEARASQEKIDRDLALQKKEEGRLAKIKKQEELAFNREFEKLLKQERAEELQKAKLASRVQAEEERQRQREVKKAEALQIRREREKNKLERQEAQEIAKRMRELEREEFQTKTLTQKQEIQREAYQQRLSLIEANKIAWQERDERRKKDKKDALINKELEKKEKLLQKEQAKKKIDEERIFNSALDSALANVFTPDEKEKRVKPYIASPSNSSILPSLLIFDIGVRDIVRALKILEQAFARFAERNLPGMFYDIPPELVGTLERRDVAFNIPKGTSVSAVQSLQDIAMRARYGDLQSLMLSKALDIQYGKDPNAMLIDALKRIENINKQSTSNARIIAQSSGLQNFYTPLIQRKQIEQYSNVRSMVTKEDIEDATKTKVEYGLFWESALDLWSKFWVNVDRANRFSSKARMEYGEREGYVYNVTINANTNDVASKLEAEIKKTIDYTRNSGIMVGRER